MLQTFKALSNNYNKLLFINTTEMKRIFFSLLTILIVTTLSNAEIKLPSILSDNMVLQREMPVTIWGWANEKENVTIEFNGQTGLAVANKDSKWRIILRPMQAGGPYDMKIKGKNEITLKNIYVGEVWVCSGQSNMEFALNQAKNAETEVANANYPSIHLFTVGHRVSEKPLEDVNNGQWKICTPKDAAGFSAVGYIFGRELYRMLNVPIGLINSSWGGTVVEAWTTMETMYTLPDYRKAIDTLKIKKFSSTIENTDAQREVWDKRTEAEDSGKIQKWYMPTINFSKWKEMKVPQLWEKGGLPDLDGVVWFAKEIELTADEAKSGFNLSLGKIDDIDQTYVNGALAGETSGYNLVRNYSVPSRFLKPGKNLIVVRIKDYGWGGGFYSAESELYYETAGQKKKINGIWKYKVGINLTSPYLTLDPNKYPSCLFNGMINPMINYNIKGVIWYQGESNAKDANKYRILLPNMISDWRKKWNNLDMTFLIVQLANFDCKGTADEGDWSVLREAQAQTATMIPKTGLACTIDIGEEHDIHPKNKQDVGLRLSLAALKIAYNKNIVASGPTFKGMRIDGSKIIIDFDNTGNGLMVNDKYKYLKGFQVAGMDKLYHWAQARIEGGQVILQSDEVPNPVSVRYAWDNNPVDANLYNKERLPAVPFRTDRQ
jgi:sialate O-acetylesterase